MMRAPRPPPPLWMTPRAGAALLAAACLVSVCYSAYRLTRRATTAPTRGRTFTADPSAAAPRDGQRGTAGGRGAEPKDVPYPPDAFPGARDVETSYGIIKVYEWGLEDGDKVLIVHGLSTPCLVLGDVAWELVRRGCRVMLFDLYGRGYSEAPLDVPLDERLYTTQIFHVLASSDLCWNGPAGFHIMGYSLGGAISTAFAAYHHNVLRSVTVVCPAGIMRTYEHDFEHRLCIDWAGWLPEWLLAAVLRPKLEQMPAPAPEPREDPDVEGRQQRSPKEREEYPPWELVPCFADQAFPLVCDVLKWQNDHNKAFVFAYMSSVRHGPLCAQHQKAWKLLGERMAANRARGKGLQKMCFILGDQDDLLPLEGCVQDAHELFGEDGAQIHVLEGNHSVAITRGREIAALAVRSWRGETSRALRGESL